MNRINKRQINLIPILLENWNDWMHGPNLSFFYLMGVGDVNTPFNLSRTPIILILQVIRTVYKMQDS